MTTYVAIITYSKHLFFLKNGNIGWQKKELTHHSSKDRLVHYLLKDEISGKIHYECNKKYSIEQAIRFFERAFLVKTGLVIGEYQLTCQLEGMPEKVILTNKMRDSFPELVTHLQRKGIELFTPTSGFAVSSSVRQIRTIEDEINAQFARLQYEGKSLNLTDDNILDLSILLGETLNFRNRFTVSGLLASLKN